MHVSSGHVLHIITGLGDGGAEAVLFRLCVNESQFCHSVVSLTDTGKYGNLFRENGINVYSLGMRRGRPSLKSLWKLCTLIRKIKPSLVQTWMYHADLIGGVVAKIFFNIPVVWNIRHSELHPGKASKSTLLVARICAFLSSRIPKYIVCCAYGALQAHRRMGYDFKKMIVIGNGYDLHRFKPNTDQRNFLRYSLGFRTDNILIGCVGRYNPDKDHANLIRALQLVRKSNSNFDCLLVGSGMTHDNQELSTLIDKHGLSKQVLLLGARDDIPAIMNAIDLHVLSSSSEGFPNVLAEAMACGTPCVTTNVGDASLIVGDYGWVVPAKSPHLLSESILLAANSFKVHADWSNRQISCRAHVYKNYNLPVMLESYREVWSQALK